MAVTSTDKPLSGEITCATLLQQLQVIWDEVGETEDERDKLLFQLDQECLDVYKRKVDQATKSRSVLLQSLADSKSELTRLLSALGDKTSVDIPDKPTGTIKEQLAAIAPTLEELTKQKEQRVRYFADVQSQIQKICSEISGALDSGEPMVDPVIDENDLSLERLDEFHSQLQELQKEKSDRLQKVLDFVSTVHGLCAILGMDLFSTITEVHPSLVDSVGVDFKSISNGTLEKLARTVVTLKEDRNMRLKKLQALASQLIDLWNLMDTPNEERSLFNHVTCNISATEDEVTVPGALALDLIEQAEIEVERLDQLKASKMKEIAFKKQRELEDIFASAHMEIDSEAAHEKILALIESGNVEPSELIADMDNQIVKAKEEAVSRKEILEKVDRWMSACEEESWLEDYNRDENRYSSSRGAHLNLRRAEKARVLVNKIPALVDTLVAKTQAWEKERGLSFMYDGVPLLAMLEEYVMLRHEREEEKRRMRDQKRFQEQISPDHETAFSTRPSPPNRAPVSKKVMSPKMNGTTPNGTTNRRLSLNSSSSANKSTGKGKRDKTQVASPVDYIAASPVDHTAVSPVDHAAASPVDHTAASPVDHAVISKEDAASHVSGNEIVPASP